MADFSFAPLQPVHAPTPREAQDLLDTAVGEADAIRLAAQAEGFAAGQGAAMDAVAPAIAALEATAATLREHAADVADRLEGEAIELAFAIAQKVLSARVEEDPEVVLEAIRGALRGLVERERVTILVHPDDLELVRDSVDGLVAALGGVEHCEIQAERRVARGGALIRYADGEVDARIETKLERAREAIVEHRSEKA